MNNQIFSSFMEYNSFVKKLDEEYSLLGLAMSREDTQKAREELNKIGYLYTKEVFDLGAEINDMKERLNFLKGKIFGARRRGLLRARLDYTQEIFEETNYMLRKFQESQGTA